MNNVKRRSLGKQQEVDLVDDEAAEISEREREMECTERLEPTKERKCEENKIGGEWSMNKGVKGKKLLGKGEIREGRERYVDRERKSVEKIKATN